MPKKNKRQERLLGYKHTIIEGRQAQLHSTQQPNDLPASYLFSHYGNDTIWSHQPAMNTSRSTYLRFLRCGLGVAVASIFFGGSVARAQDVYLVCENDYQSVLNLPIFPQILNANIVILTDAATPIGNHGVTVVDTDHSNNVALFNFNVLSGGVVSPSQNSTTSTYGVSPTSTPYKYFSTTIGTYIFAGDNFPLGAWPSNSNWQASPVIDHRQFNLDETVGWVGTPATSKNLTIESDYHYTQWAWHTFLGYQLPYIPGASAAAPIYKSIIFDLRGNPQGPPPAPAPNPQCPFCPTCPSCPGSTPTPSPHLGGASAGMATASLDRFQAGIVITDTPISYTPGVGMAMGFTLSYHQRLANQPATFNSSNLGPQWSSSWLSHIEGGPTGGQAEATYYATDGNQYTYGGYQPTVVQGQGLSVVNTGDFQATEGWTHATLHYRQNPERYERWLPDGTVEIYAQPAGTFAKRQFFLSLITDPQGNVTTLNYDPTAAGNGQAVLTSVTDPTGSQLLFSYGTTNPLQIVKVTRSNDGLSAKFEYTNGQLTSITDTIGITSSYHYVAGTNFIDKMTTPYGNSTFGSTDGATSLEADITNPLLQVERVEYQESLSTSLFAATESSVPSKTGLTTDNTNLNYANSFYWSRRAMADAAAGSIATDSSGFYALAQVSHWAGTSSGTIPVPISTKMPLEGRVWYNYPGQSNVDYVDVTAASASTSPSVTARLVNSGSGTATQASFASYNGNGLITQSIDPIGRTTNYNYATNGIDLLTVKQVNGSGQDLLSTMTYNSQHEPLTMTDAAGQTTTMTYYGNGQLNTRTVVVGGSNQTTTLAYNSSGYLSSVTGPISGATTSYTYDSAGRVHTVTDSEGYVLTMAYDNLDRLISTTYPDSTTDQTFYTNLDVDHTIDRQGRVTRNTYDAIRELLTTTDPLGRVTQYAWCTCGGLSKLTDANGNATNWGLDEQGRVTSKTYADSSVINYVYESNSSRLHTMTDARGSVATYAYNNDNTLSGTTYSLGSGVATTPNVSFSYDTVYNRVTGMTDGTGTTSYSYNPINAALGAGRLDSVSVPISSSTASVTYRTSGGGAGSGYDELGRVVSRGIDSANYVGTTFDALGRVTNVSNALGAFTYAYVDQTSRLSSVTYPVGTGGTGHSMITNYTYFGNTGDQRLEEIQNLKYTTPLSKFDYTYNAVGTIATWTQQADSGTAVVNTLSYDGADQLTNAVQSGGGSASNAYHYDPAGNRLAEITATTTTAGQFNNLNQLKGLSSSTTSTTVAGHTSAAVTSATIDAVPATISGSTNFTANVPLPNGTNVVSVVAQPTSSSGVTTTQRVQIVKSGTAPTALVYDANGNVTTDENGNTYTWDALNRLTKITYSGGATSNFAYDGLSRRISIIEKNSGGTITSTKLYLWIGQQIAEERSSGTTVTKRFFPQGEQQSGTNYYYTRDHLGSVREMLNSSGTIVARYQYDPYGRVTLVSGSNLATFQWARLYAHQPSGLDLPDFRGGYDPTVGRWIQRDHVGESGGINLYDYCTDNPINLADPLGFEGTWTFSITPGDGERAVVSASYQMSAEDKKCCDQVEVRRWVMDIFGFNFWNDTPSDGGLPGNNHGQRAYAPPDQPGGFLGPLPITSPTIMPRDMHFKWCAVCTKGKAAGKTLSCRDRIVHLWWNDANFLTPQGDGSYQPTKQ